MKGWSQAPERGPAWIVHLMLWLMRHFGWFADRIVLPGITAWFFVTSGAARAASREYLPAALGRPATQWDVLRHIHSFASSILDRALLLTGRADRLSLNVSGLEHVEALLAEGRGCVLLGAHLGSFAVLRGLAQRCPIPVKILMYRANAGAYSTLMERLDPGSASSVIPIGDIQSMLRVHEEIAAGAVVGILADRSPPGARQVTVPFFGRSAAFPVGPFVLAASLGVPVMLFRGVRTQNRRYEISFTPFSERVVLRRAAREADLIATISRYALWLEQSCRAHPFNWFNFYAFWERAEHVSTQARPVVASPRPTGGTLLGANLDPAA